MWFYVTKHSNQCCIGVHFDIFKISKQTTYPKKMPVHGIWKGGQLTMVLVSLGSQMEGYSWNGVLILFHILEGRIPIPSIRSRIKYIDREGGQWFENHPLHTFYLYPTLLDPMHRSYCKRKLYDHLCPYYYHYELCLKAPKAFIANFSLSSKRVGG